MKTKYVLQKAFLFLYFILGSTIIYKFINLFSYRNSLSFSEIKYNNSIFIESILLSIFFNTMFVLYLLKSFCKDVLIKYVIFLYVISLTLILLTQFHFLPSLPVILGIFLYFLFLSKLSIQNFTIFSLIFLILFPLNIKKFSQSNIQKGIICAIIFLFLLILPHALFPQYWIGTATIFDYF